VTDSEVEPRRDPGWLPEREWSTAQTKAEQKSGGRIESQGSLLSNSEEASNKIYRGWRPAQARADATMSGYE
jgi:hypothetical protein